MNIIAIEISPAVDAIGTLQTFYLSSQKFITNAASTPAHTNFDPTVIDPGEITLAIFNNGVTMGDTTLSVGEILISNIDGAYDAWFDYGFDNRRITIRSADTTIVGTDPTYPAQFTTLFSGVMSTVVGGMDTIGIRVIDKQALFDKPYLTERYAGTNVGPAGLEGTNSDIGGTIKGRALGLPFNITPPCVNTSNLVYRASTSGGFIQAVRDRGAPLTAGASFLNADDMVAATVTAGTYARCADEGLFRLGALPAGLITADIQEAYAGSQLLYINNPENAIWTQAGLSVVTKSIAAPDENITGNTLKATAGASVKTISQAITSVNANVYMTVSGYFQKGTHPYVYLTALGSANNWASAVFDLNALTMTQSGAGVTSGDVRSTTITDDGYGWVYITLTARVNVANPSYSFGLAGAASGNTFDTSGKISWTAAGSETVYTWGLACYYGSRGTPWRDFYTTHFQSNLFIQSNAFDNVAWTKVNATVTPDVLHRYDIATLPTDVDLITNTVAASLAQTVTGLTAGIPYNAHIAIKRGANIADFTISDGTNWFLTVNPDTQTVTASGGQFFINAVVARYNADWMYLTVAFTASAASVTITFGIGAPTTGTGSIYLGTSGLAAGIAQVYHVSTTTAQISTVTFIRLASDALRHLSLVGGLRQSEFNEDDALKLWIPGESGVGYNVADDKTILKTMADLVGGTTVFYYFDFNGQFRLGIWTPPENETSTVSFTTLDFGDDYERLPLPGAPVPIYRITANWQKNWTVQTTDLAGSVTAANRAIYASDWSSVVTQDLSIKRKHINAGELELSSYYTSNAVGLSLGSARLALLGVRRDLISITLPYQQGLTLGQVVNITLPRFGMQAGKNMRIQAIDLKLKDGTMRLTCWG